MSFENDIEQCLSVLKSGGIILHPTDTIWGIGCDATNAHAIEKIITLKKRPAQKSFVILVADERDILKHTAAPDLAIFDYLQAANKPTTVIYKGALGLAENVLAEDGSAAIRIAKDEFCRHLIRCFRKPIVSTSANFSGEVSPANFASVSPEIINGVAYAVYHRRTEIGEASASTIIKWESGKAEIIRS